jgi:hypothetical protein
MSKNLLKGILFTRVERVEGKKLKDMGGAMRSTIQLTPIHFYLKDVGEDEKIVWRYGDEIIHDIDQQVTINYIEMEQQIKNDIIKKLIISAMEQELAYDENIQKLENELNRMDELNADLIKKLEEAKEKISSLAEAEEKISYLEGANEKIIGENKELDKDLEKAIDRISIIESIILTQVYNIEGVIDGLTDSDVIQKLKNISEGLMGATKPDNYEDDDEEDTLIESANEQAVNDISKQDDFKIAGDTAVEKGIDQAISEITDDKMIAEEENTDDKPAEEKAVVPEQAIEETAEQAVETPAEETAAVDAATNQETTATSQEEATADQIEATVENVESSPEETVVQACDIDGDDCVDDEEEISAEQAVEETADQAITDDKPAEVITAVQADETPAEGEDVAESSPEEPAGQAITDDKSTDVITADQADDTSDDETDVVDAATSQEEDAASVEEIFSTDKTNDTPGEEAVAESSSDEAAGQAITDDKSTDVITADQTISDITNDNVVTGEETAGQASEPVIDIAEDIATKRKSLEFVN